MQYLSRNTALKVKGEKPILGQNWPKRKISRKRSFQNPKSVANASTEKNLVTFNAAIFYSTSDSFN